MGGGRILILGGTGMLGHVLFRQLSKHDDYEVFATVRNYPEATQYFPLQLAKMIRTDSVDADNFDTVIRALASIQPDIVINCIGLIKQLPMATDPLSAITVNAYLPHRISLICRAAHARMIHVSTDCVFMGKKGMYVEADIADADDLYGRTKYLGEVNYPHCVTLRTSIIGHELKGRHGLIEWFLSQDNSIKGYSKAIFSGFPTIELARIIRDHVLPHPELSGTYHVSAEPISKYNLLVMVAEKYGKTIDIQPCDDFVQDRSLDSTIFRSQTGYNPPSWSELVTRMHEDYVTHLEPNYALARK